ncbi:MAG: DNA translocase FtsK [Rikenellaceae bacterium]|nr:DNA translocase FtsK [Rikenellaceae bacterium]MCL2692031.1 DNA translocase FtsK [Rikenellaceae bacterium]
MTAKKTEHKTRTVKEKTVSGGMSDTQRWVLGVVLFAFSVFLLIAVASYYFTWQADQMFVRHGELGYRDSGVVANQTGRLGATLAHYVVSQWFGIFGVVIPAMLIIITLRLIDFRPALLSKSVRIGLISMILGSLTLGLLFDERWDVFGTGLGGAHGIYVSRWIVSYLGVMGAGLALLLGWILLGVYITRRTILVVNRVGRGLYESGRKVGSKMVAHREDGSEEYYEEDDYYIKEEEPPVFVPPATHQSATHQHVQHHGEPPRREVSHREAAIEIVRPMREPVREFAPEPVSAQKSSQTAANAESHAVFTVVTAEREPQPEPVHASRDPNVVMFGEPYSTDPRADSRVVEVVQPQYHGQYHEANNHAAQKNVTHDNRGPFEVVQSPHAPQSEPQQPRGPFEVVSRPAGAPLAAGGILEESAPTAVNAAGAGAAKQAGQMQVVVAARADAVTDDDDIDAELYDPTRELSRYEKPPVELLEDHAVDAQVTEDEVYENKNQIVSTLQNFGIKIDKIKATIGPTVTLYEIIPAAGVKISKIKNLEDDIALSLKALGIRIIAPMPGKGTIGIEVPNKDKEIVSMSSVIRARRFQESRAELPIVLGKTISNETFTIDLAQMPHLLVAGATGQGKSVGLNAIITSLLYKKHPAELKFVFVDPKRVELSLYAKLERHFLAKMQSEDEAILTETQKVVYTLQALCMEMSARYDLLRAAEVKKIAEYNEKFLKRRLSPKKGHRYLPYIVVVVDEFADLIMTAGREIEAPLTRLAQLARAVGIHLVIATQRPDVKVITGLIKANFPARIAFRVMSMVDSRTIIDQPGANQLIGRGDMLMSQGGELTRVQCAFIDTPEIERITEFIGNQRGYAGPYDLPDYQPEGDAGGERLSDLGPLDPMFEEVARFVVQNQQGSTSSIQRRFSIGYNRAGRIMDQLEDAGIVSRADGSKPREVLLMDIMSLEHILGNIDR